MLGGQPSEGFEDFAPDLAVEIVSPSEQPDEMARKVAEHFGAGAEQVWHLFPDTRRVTVYYSPFDTADFGPEETLDGDAGWRRLDGDAGWRRWMETLDGDAGWRRWMREGCCPASPAGRKCCSTWSE